jgi:hypothetical protein
MMLLRAMPLNTWHLFLISPELGNQFILISNSIGAARRQFAHVWCKAARLIGNAAHGSAPERRVWPESNNG